MENIGCQKKTKIAVVGIGQIGELVIRLLQKVDRYTLYAVDHRQINSLNENVRFINCDVGEIETFQKILLENQIDAIVSCLPFFANEAIVQLAKDLSLHYFDLTEDVHSTENVKAVSEDARTAFVPQCGLAPGFVDIVAHSMAARYQKIDSMKLRVGALPTSTSNSLKYLFSWSIDGLINEYCEPCVSIINGHKVHLMPLEGLETVSIDGVEYECFNTSGGVGSLADTYLGKVNHLTYQTIRYPGHCQIMRLLINELNLRDDRKTLIRILKNAIPYTQQDVVLIYISIVGEIDGVLKEESYLKKVYGQKIDGIHFNAIQTTTAGALCAVVDQVLTHPNQYRGFVRQEEFSPDDVINGPFGFCYQSKES